MGASRTSGGIIGGSSGNFLDIVWDYRGLKGGS